MSPQTSPKYEQISTPERKRNVALPSAPLKAERKIGLNLRLLLFKNVYILNVVIKSHL